MIEKYLKLYSETNEEKFNDDLINLKEQDDVLECFNDIFKALEVIEGIKFLDSEIFTNENEFAPILKGKEKQEVQNIEISRLNMIKFRFSLTGKVKPQGKKEEIHTEIIEKYLYYPKALPGFHFVLNNSKYFPIYQIIDSATYRHADSLTLKTLLMPIKITLLDENVYLDTDGNEFKGRVKTVELFKKKINHLNYFFTEFGFNDTLEFFSYKDDVMIIDNTEDINPDFTYFNMGKKGQLLGISKRLLKEDPTFAFNLIDILHKEKIHQIFDHEYWIYELGKKFKQNKLQQKEKADDIMLSFKRILDGRTKRILPLEMENKESIFHLVRWMVTKFEILKVRNNMDLENKRMRVSEYLIYDLLKKFSTITYRILNTNNVMLKEKRQLFSSLSPMFVIKSMGSNELLRYLGGVNSIDLFNSRLKFSYRGPQGLGKGKSSVNLAYRGIDPSYIGRIGLVAASANDPGMSGTLVPFMETNGFYFSKDKLD